MGGIRNLEAKKKANHVAASGAIAGANKGPSKVDKRNEALPCPYCDKTYTQAQSSRLQDHIKKKHADLVEGSDAGPAPGRPSARSEDAGGPSTAPAPSAAPSTKPDATSKRSASGAKLADAPPVASGSGSGGVRAASPGAVLAPVAPAPGGPASDPHMMDIGSPAGYYKYKSPRLHLLEWSQREGRGRPRYVVKEGKPHAERGGSATCKVVIAHPKKKEEDVVVFLDPRWAEGADGLELEQRAAVAALHRVAGDRNYHMLLPKAYLGMWQDLGQAAEQRREAAAQRAVTDAQRAVRRKARAAVAARRAPAPLMMSREKQALIQQLLQERDEKSRAGSSGVNRAAVDAFLAEVQPGLLDLGFTPAQAQAAAKAIATAGLLGGLDACVDWLVTNIPAAQLPDSFTVGAHLARPVSRITAKAETDAQDAPGRRAPPSPASSPPLTGMAAEQAARVAQLTAFGYHPARCEAALAEAGGDVWGAHRNLYAALTTRTSRASAAPAAVALPREAFQEAGVLGEELLVLDSMYGDAVTVTPEQAALRITQPLPDGCAASSGEFGDRNLVLHAWLVSYPEGDGRGGGPGAAYPDAPPVLGVTCGALRPAALRTLTARVAQHAAGLVGQPMLYELAAHLMEAAEQLGPVTDMDHDGSDSNVAGLGEPCNEQGWDSDGGGSKASGQESASTADVEVDEELATDGEGDNDDYHDASASERGRSSALGSERDLTDVASSAGQPDGASEMSESREPETDDLVEQFEGTGLGDLAGGGPLDGDGMEGGNGISGLLTTETNVSGRAQSVGPIRPGSSRGGRAGPLPEAIAAESARLRVAQEALQGSGANASIRDARRRLPAAAMRGDVLAALRRHAVLVISGATGCGKSTQVPQFVLEDAIQRGSGGATNIIVTQPRRISALGLAQRVAAERGEQVGETVGYSVRMDSCTSARTRLLFCTTGVLLRRLLSDPMLTATTHVVLDEVHERSIEIDLLLLLLRDVVAQRALAATGADAAAPPLQLVLMSATADAQLFADYMNDRLGAAAARVARAASNSGANGSGAFLSVGQLTIPGFTYPVRELYLEDALELTGTVIGAQSRYAKHRGKGGPRNAAAQSDGDAGSGPGGAYSRDTLRSLAIVDEAVINYDLLAALLTHIVREQQARGPAACMDGWQEGLDALKQVGGGGGGGGAVLVFLPGAPEISRAARVLRDHAPLAAAAGGAHKLRILPLHGSLSAQDQAAVFGRPPAGTVKVVLSTNVAETSITIDDVGFVVDTGRAKEMGHDPDRGILRLLEQWVSKAAAQQRRGRAGRVRPGVCFRLFSRAQWGRMPSHTTPEILRSPLESVVLLIKGLAARRSARQQQQGGGMEGGRRRRVADVLAQCLSPPEPAAVEAAVQLLQGIGALDDVEGLTPLGTHLNAMPMDPRVGKMLVFGALLGCLDPVLTVAAALAHGRPVFLAPPPDKSATINDARRPLLVGAAAARSDHIALVAAYNTWARAAEQGRRGETSALCSQCALSESSLEAVAAGRAEYAGVLSELGFIPRPAAALLRKAGRRRSAPAPPGAGDLAAWRALPVNANADDARFLKAAVMAGFYPCVLRVQHPDTTYRKLEGSGAVRVEAAAKELKFFDAVRGRAFIHPASVNFAIGEFATGWMVYTQMVATSKLFVREASMAPVYSLLLFGGALHIDVAARTLSVGEHAAFTAAPAIGVLIRRLRAALDDVLHRKIADPGFEMSSDPVVGVVSQLLATDGY